METKSTTTSGVISTITKANPYPSSQIPENLHNYFKNGRCVQPEFDKSELFDLYKYCDVHANCINKTAKIATCSGYEFIDEVNAENATKFAEEPEFTVMRCLTPINSPNFFSESSSEICPIITLIL